MAERAGFEPAEEREPLDGLANRCLGPLDYLSNAAILPPGGNAGKPTAWSLLGCSRESRSQAPGVAGRNRLRLRVPWLGRGTPERLAAVGPGQEFHDKTTELPSGSPPSVPARSSTTRRRNSRATRRRRSRPGVPRQDDGTPERLAVGLRVALGGGGGIRTREARGPAGFQDRWLRPLTHPSGIDYRGTDGGAARRERIVPPPTRRSPSYRTASCPGVTARCGGSKSSANESGSSGRNVVRKAGER